MEEERKNLRDESWCNELAKVYMHRGIAKHDAPGFSPIAALDDHNAGIALREALRDDMGADWPPQWGNDLAKAYLNRGIAKRSVPGFGLGAAIDEFGEAIALMKALRTALGDRWPVGWRRDLARAYMIRSSAKSDAPRFGSVAAIADYDDAIKLMEAVGEGWPVRWGNDLAGAYMTRGNARRSAPDFDPGDPIDDYIKAIDLMEALGEALGKRWPVRWRNDLAIAYINRGNAKQRAPDFHPEAAIADYNAAIAIWEALKADLGDKFPPAWDHWLQQTRVERDGLTASPTE
jgi:tetratricopeptide (TPR) repeat protein